MTVEKKSKRQLRREQIQRKQTRSRLVTISIITVVAAFLVFVFVSPILRSAGEIITVTPVDLPNPDGLTLGDPNAPVTVEVFEDFQCPACRNFTETTQPLIIEYLIKPGKVKYTFHHYPFLDGDNARSGGESDQAANAAMCANEQGRFWDMSAILFANWNGENQGNLNNTRLKAMAESIGLEMNDFNDCFNANKYEDEIQADFEYGKELGASGTPSVFVNGKQVGQPGYIPQYQEIAEAVELAISVSP